MASARSFGSVPRAVVACVMGLALHGSLVLAADRQADVAAPEGQRIFSAGHSFHMFMPRLLSELAEARGIAAHRQVDAQGIGGSRVIQHWELPEGRNKLKPALASGEVDVLTLSPIYLPDEGIEKCVQLALEHNPNVRVLVQQNWLPYDVYDPNYKQQRPAPVDRNARTSQELRSLPAEYHRSLEDHAEALNKSHGRTVVFIVPAGQAAIALREKIIAGQAPGLEKQDDLFRDAIGHPTPPLRALVAYCYYAMIYRESPVGLSPPPSLAAEDARLQNEALNRLLQELAWEVVAAQPSSGVSQATHSD